MPFGVCWQQSQGAAAGTAGRPPRCSQVASLAHTHQGCRLCCRRGNCTVLSAVGRLPAPLNLWWAATLPPGWAVHLAAAVTARASKQHHQVLRCAASARGLPRPWLYSSALAVPCCKSRACTHTRIGTHTHVLQRVVAGHRRLGVGGSGGQLLHGVPGSGAAGARRSGG